MSRHTFLLSVLTGTLVSAPIPSTAMALVRDGQPACVVVLAPDASDQEKLAAHDLQLYLKKMSGAAISIGADPAVAGNRVLLGVFGQRPVQDWNGQRPRPDGFAIETQARAAGGTDLLLVGGDQRGAAYAVYELLERFLGVRWYMPTELGEEVPERKTVELEVLQWRNQPDFEFIAGLAWPGDGRAGPGALDWLRHNKGEVGPASYMFGHSCSGYIDPTDANKKAHPEWFALNTNGTRSDQLCTSNPEVIRIFVEKT